MPNQPVTNDQQDVDLDTLFDNARASGNISGRSQALLKRVAPRIQTTMPPAPLKNRKNQERVVFLLIPDNSGSTAWGDNYKSIVEGVNIFRDALLDAEVAAEVLILMMNDNPRYVSKVMGDPSATAFTWMDLESLPTFTEENWVTGETPLHFRLVQGVGSAIAREQYWSSRKNVRVFVVLITDGKNEVYSNDIPNTSADDAHQVMTDFLRQENHRAFAMVVNNPDLDAAAICAQLGFNADDTRDVQRDKHAIRAWCQTASRAVKAASKAASPSSVKLGSPDPDND